MLNIILDLLILKKQAEEQAVSNSEKLEEVLDENETLRDMLEKQNILAMKWQELALRLQKQIDNPSAKAISILKNDVKAFNQEIAAQAESTKSEIQKEALKQLSKSQTGPSGKKEETKPLTNPEIDQKIKTQVQSKLLSFISDKFNQNSIKFELPILNQAIQDWLKTESVADRKRVIDSANNLLKLSDKVGPKKAEYERVIKDAIKEVTNGKISL